MRLVGVSMRVDKTRAYAETRDAISHDWMKLLSQHGVMPLLIPNTPLILSDLLDRLEIPAFLLTGGNNVGPLNRAECQLGIDDVSADRDATERKIIEFAIKNRLPLLSVCRGMHMVNAYFGGTLVRDLSRISGHSDAHVAIPHEVELVDADYRCLLGTSSMVTNSFHRHAVTRATLASELREFALSADGVVEGFYHPELPIVGIQWHPERANPAEGVDRRLIQSWLESIPVKCT